MVCKSMTPVDWYLIPCSAEMPFIDKGLCPSIHCSIDFLPVVCWMYFQCLNLLQSSMKWDGYKNELIMILPLKFGHTVTPMKHFSTIEEEKEVEYEFTFYSSLEKELWIAYWPISVSAVSDLSCSVGGGSATFGVSCTSATKQVKS